jgi:hypothetical protein
MATANDNICDVCDAPVTANPECPLVVYVSAHRVGGPGFLDPTGLSAGVITLVSAQGTLPRLELDGACASEHIHISPEIVRRLNERMLVTRQISAEQAAKRQAQADAEHAAYIRSEAKRLDKAAAKVKGE